MIVDDDQRCREYNPRWWSTDDHAKKIIQVDDDKLFSTLFSRSRKFKLRKHAIQRLKIRRETLLQRYRARAHGQRRNTQSAHDTKTDGRKERGKTKSRLYTSKPPPGGVREIVRTSRIRCVPRGGGVSHRNQSCAESRGESKSGVTLRGGGSVTGRNQSGPEFHERSKSGKSPRGGGVRDPETKVVGNLM